MNLDEGTLTRQHAYTPTRRHADAWTIVKMLGYSFEKQLNEFLFG